MNETDIQEGDLAELIGLKHFIKLFESNPVRRFNHISINQNG
jgi:hypothetical protein